MTSAHTARPPSHAVSEPRTTCFHVSFDYITGVNIFYIFYDISVNQQIVAQGKSTHSMNIATLGEYMFEYVSD